MKNIDILPALFININQSLETIQVPETRWGHKKTIEYLFREYYKTARKNEDRNLLEHEWTWGISCWVQIRGRYIKWPHSLAEYKKNNIRNIPKDNRNETGLW